MITRPVHVLVIDDHQVIARNVSEMLCRAGHRTSIALSGREGLKAFLSAQSNDAFAIVITDFSMADLNGLAVAAAVKRVSPSTPVILLTAYGLDDDDALPPHIDAVLAKPPSDDELRAAVTRMLAQ